MIPELCVVKYQSVTKSDSHCIIKSGCKIRHSNGTSSSDELPDNRKEKTTRLAPCEEKTKWSNMRIKDVYRSRLRQIEQPKQRINGTSKYVYRKRLLCNQISKSAECEKYQRQIICKRRLIIEVFCNESYTKFRTNIWVL